MGTESPCLLHPVNSITLGTETLVVIELALDEPPLGQSCAVQCSVWKRERERETDDVAQSSFETISRT